MCASSYTGVSANVSAINKWQPIEVLGSEYGCDVWSYLQLNFKRYRLRTVAPSVYWVGLWGFAYSAAF